MIIFALLNQYIKNSVMSDSSVAIRLKHFIDYKELPVTQFADLCGIPRPTLSQLLSGRNKKLSNVIVGLIHDRFPELSVLWLMFGEGEMLVPAPINPTLMTEAEKFMDDVSEFDDDAIFSELNTSKNTVNNPNNRVVREPFRVSQSVDKIEIPAQKCKKVTSITVFFDDNSYEVFVPSGSK